MRKNHKIMAALLAIALVVLTSIGGLAVFAESEESVDSEQIEIADNTTAVSGCDLKSENLIRVKVKQYGFSMLVPQDNVITLESDPSVFASSDYSRSYFMEQGCILYAYADKQNYCAVTVFVSDQDSIYDYYGDYAKLSDAKRDELVAAASSETATAEFVTINGRSYIQVTTSDNTSGENYTQYQFTTVINQKQYMIYIQTMNADDKDKAVLNEMIGSIKLGGQGLRLDGADMLLTVLVVILTIAVAVIYFFFYRANQFVKLGITNYPRLGFDLPKPNELKESDVFDEEDDEEEDEEDDESEDEDDEEDEEEDNSDERIIKD